MPRTAFHADESFFENGQYLVIEATEGATDYIVVERRARLADAVDEANRRNLAAGLTLSEAQAVYVSSLAARFGDADLGP